MTRRKALAAVVGTAAAAAVLAFTSPQEGVSLTPYSDKLASNIATVCYGETKAEMRPYTLPECKAMLDSSMADYADAVRDLTPGFDTLEQGQKVAVIDFAYNAGIGNYKSSTLRKQYGAKNFPAACEEFLKWRFVNGGRTDCAIAANNCGGIMKRRTAERSACLGENL